MESKIKDETINSRLKGLRKILRVTRSFIYNKYGLSQDTLKSWETDKKITPNGLDKCLEIYRNEGISVTKEWVLTGNGPNPKISFDINRYLEEITSNSSLHEINDELLILEEINFFKNLSENSVVIMVKNNDMLPFYQPGDYVGGRFQKDLDIDSIIGFNCIVKHDLSFMIKRIIRNEKLGTNLVITNPSYGSLSDPVIYNYTILPEQVAPICWHRRPIS
jgi:hypothetical protein